jgi:hypothetical protein
VAYIRVMGGALETETICNVARSLG